jgi:hypothetical protein
MPLRARVYDGPDPDSAPLTAPVLLGVRVMSPAAKPVMAWLKVRVNAVVVAVALPLAARPLNVTATFGAA